MENLRTIQVNANELRILRSLRELPEGQRWTFN